MKELFKIGKHRYLRLWHLRKHKYRMTPYTRKHDGDHRYRFTCEYCEDSYSTAMPEELAPGGYCNRYTFKGVIGNLFRTYLE